MGRERKKIEMEERKEQRGKTLENGAAHIREKGLSESILKCATNKL